MTTLDETVPTSARRVGEPRIVLSCIPVRDGGGRTVARATIRAIANDPELRDVFTVVARTELVEALDPGDRATVVAVSDHRVSAEVQLARVAARSGADWVVSLFGPPPMLPRRSRRATVCAYAQLFDPAGAGGDLRARLVRRVRMWSLRRCDVVFFETSFLRDRAAPRLASSGRSLRVLRPSREPELELELQLITNRPTGDGPRRILLFSEHRPNKGWSVIPAVSGELSRRGLDVEFVLTSDDASEIVASAAPAGRRVRQIGRVPTSRRAELLGGVDALLLVSRVESYSNNYHEAWTAGLPLVVSDTDWARAELGDAAVFVDRESPASIADGIERALSGPERDRLRTNGYRQLSRMPTPEQRLAALCAELGPAGP